MNITQKVGGKSLYSGSASSYWQLSLPYLSAFAALLLASHVLWRYQKLSSFRGPPLAALSDVPHRLAMLGGQCHLFYAQANKKYGKTGNSEPIGCSVRASTTSQASTDFHLRSGV